MVTSDLFYVKSSVRNIAPTAFTYAIRIRAKNCLCLRVINCNSNEYAQLSHRYVTLAKNYNTIYFNIYSFNICILFFIATRIRS